MKNKGEGFFSSKGLLLVVVLIVFILVLSFFFGDSGFLDIRGKKKEIEITKAEVERLKKERDQLAEEVEELEKDPLALEKTAREQLWLMKKNEKVIVLIDPKEQEKKEADRENSTDEPAKNGDKK